MEVVAFIRVITEGKRLIVVTIITEVAIIAITGNNNRDRNNRYNGKLPTCENNAFGKQANSSEHILISKICHVNLSLSNFK